MPRPSVKIETRKLYGLHARYSTFKVRWKTLLVLLKRREMMMLDKVVMIIMFILPLSCSVYCG